MFLGSENILYCRLEQFYFRLQQQILYFRPEQLEPQFESEHILYFRPEH